MPTKEKSSRGKGFVAITDLRHGNEDGSTININRGSNLNDFNVPEELVHEWYASGALAVSGSRLDPNTLPALNHPHDTTPALVEQALQAQADYVDAGVPLPLGMHTQEGYSEAPENPTELLEGVNNTDARPVLAPTSAGEPRSATAQAVKQNAASDPGTNKESTDSATESE